VLSEDVDLLARLGTSAAMLRGRIEADALFAAQADGALNADQRQHALAVFAEVMDHCFALDRISQVHLQRWRRETIAIHEAGVPHFDVAYLAYLEKLSLGLTLVDATINRPAFEKLLDEGSEDLGLPPGAYGKLKWAVVHVEDVTKVLTGQTYLATLRGINKVLVKGDPRFVAVLDRINTRFAAIKGRLTARSVKLFGGNSVDIGADLAHAAWFPIQASTAEWLGDTKVLRKNRMLISAAQVQEAIARSEPGDIIVERRNWYLSNIGLPGFWPHAALWLGSPKELRAWADDDELKAAFNGLNFADALRTKYPKAWVAYATAGDEGHQHRIIEAVSEGVVFSPAEESIHADYVAALRPNRSKVEKARAIERAFGYAFRPYDFDFDFETDGALVCSELVRKSYEPRDGVDGVPLPLERMMGRYTLGPNSIVKSFDEHCGEKDPALVFAWFLDGSERNKNASFADEAAFRSTWRRPKWDIVQQ